MADQWFLARNNKKSGPYTTAQLAELAASGHVRATDMVLAVGGQKWVQACQVVTCPLPKAPAAKPALPMVAGIANGSVYINEGTASGIKEGDRFQVVRKVDVGLKDPQTGQAITEKHKVCVLVIANVNDNSSSGTCQGGLPQSGDMAEPVHP